MTTPQAASGKHTIVLSPKAEKQLDELMERFGDTTGRTIEKALDLLDHVKKCEDAGYKVCGVKQTPTTIEATNLDRIAL